MIPYNERITNYTILLIFISVLTNHLGVTVGYPMYVLFSIDITFIYYMYIGAPVIIAYGG